MAVIKGKGKKAKKVITAKLPVSKEIMTKLRRRQDAQPIPTVAV